MNTPRRSFFKASACLAAAGLAMTRSNLAAQEPTSIRPRQRIGVSTYSFFKFGGSKNTPVDRCIELAADMALMVSSSCTCRWVTIRHPS